jgi:hypothetical protein
MLDDTEPEIGHTFIVTQPDYTYRPSVIIDVHVSLYLILFYLSSRFVKDQKA